MSDHGPSASGGGFDLIEFATRRRVTIAMMTLTLVLFGLISLSSLKVELLPDLSYPTLTVRTEYTGAAPSEIETLISEPVEEAVEGRRYAGGQAENRQATLGGGHPLVGDVQAPDAQVGPVDGQLHAHGGLAAAQRAAVAAPRRERR